MKNAINGVVAAFALAVAAFFGVYGGPSLIQLLSGATPLTGSFEEAEGTYASYEAVWPVASYGVEYYSGDPDRISKWSYVIYDEERQAFMCVIASDRVNGSFNSLMRQANPVQGQKSSDIEPITVKGTLQPMRDDQIEAALSALTGGDSKSTREMDEIALAQTNWYSIEYGLIDGLGAGSLGLMAVTFVLNVIIFLVALKGLFRKEQKESEEELLNHAFAGSKLEQLMAVQRLWLTPWNEQMKTRNMRMSFLAVVLGVAIPTAIGFWVGMSLPGILALHLPLGLIIGEILGVVGWFSQRISLNTEKTLNIFRQRIENILPSPEACEEFAQDILNGAREGAFREKTKEEMKWVAVGDRYWAVFGSMGMVNVVDASLVERVATHRETGEFHTGKVRTIYVRYIASIYYKNSSRKKDCDYQLAFEAEETLGFLVAHIRKHQGDAIEIFAL